MTMFCVVAKIFTLPFTTVKRQRCEKYQGVASTVQGAYLDVHSAVEATEKGCRFAPNTEASPM